MPILPTVCVTVVILVVMDITNLTNLIKSSSLQIDEKNQLAR